ncbi:hypothetical protein RFI_24118 [Reticulomyxa filosa]|uniref:Uncharacterized protein n=1 Tax=Reticulomyxa filosa TaxID=46433 RepID=X6MHX1_RETFI|nr:hypothetical protein RFI_24118 [Reticulomyxa filosa]|eukprot:ETO13256.1 hypothetical protein RFI_24118 [Reticulomyxa filosa]
MTLFQSLYGQCQEVIGIGAFSPYDFHDNDASASSSSTFDEEHDVDQGKAKKDKFVRIYVVGEFQSLAQQIEWNRFMDEALQYTDDVLSYFIYYYYFFFFCKPKRN